MASLAAAKGAAALLLVVLFVLFAGRCERRQPATIEGYVYHTCIDGYFVGPVAGAIISISVDATTVRTDANGHFTIRTENAVFGDEFYTVTARAGDVAVTDKTMLYNGVSRLPRQVSFVVSPPEPVMTWSSPSRRFFCRPYPLGHTAANSRD